MVAAGVTAALVVPGAVVVAVVGLAGLVLGAQLPWHLVGRAVIFCVLECGAVVALVVLVVVATTVVVVDVLLPVAFGTVGGCRATRARVPPIGICHE